jgi:hypothetical protein
VNQHWADAKFHAAAKTLGDLEKALFTGEGLFPILFQKQILKYRKIQQIAKNQRCLF